MLNQEIIQQKQCSCKSTSSGPRVVTQLVTDAGGVWAQLNLAEMACDECDKPWSWKSYHPIEEVQS